MSVPGLKATLFWKRGVIVGSCQLVLNLYPLVEDKPAQIALADLESGELREFLQLQRLVLTQHPKKLAFL